MRDQTPWTPDDPGIRAFNAAGEKIGAWLHEYWWALLGWAVIVFAAFHLFGDWGWLAVVLGLLYLAYWRAKDTDWGRAVAADLTRLREIVWDALMQKVFCRQTPASGGAPSNDANIAALAGFNARAIPAVVWPSPAQDEAHARYRSEYEKLTAAIDGLPRGVDHPNSQDRRALVLYQAEILDGLINYGDNPLAIMAPAPTAARIRPLMGGVGGAVGGGFLRGLSQIHLWLIGGLVALSGFLFARGEVIKAQLDDARDDARENAQIARSWQARSGEYEQGFKRALEANEQLTQRVSIDQRETRELMEAAQRSQRAAELRERRRRDQQIRSIDAPPDFGGLLRDVAGAESIGPADAGGGGGDSGAGGDSTS